MWITLSYFSVLRYTIQNMAKEKLLFKDQTSNKVKINSKRKKVFSILSILLVTFVVFGGFQYLKMRKFMENRRAAMNLQRQVLVDSWKADGLTDEEIEEKLSDMNMKEFDSEGRSSNPLFILRRVVTSHRSSNGGPPRGGMHP